MQTTKFWTYWSIWVRIQQSHSPMNKTHWYLFLNAYCNFTICSLEQEATDLNKPDLRSSCRQPLLVPQLHCSASPSRKASARQPRSQGLIFPALETRLMCRCCFQMIAKFIPVDIWYLNYVETLSCSLLFTSGTRARWTKTTKNQQLEKVRELMPPTNAVVHPGVFIRYPN